MTKEICRGCSGHEVTKGVCDCTLCFMLPGTTKDRLKNVSGLNIRLHIYYACGSSSIFGLVRDNALPGPAFLSSDS